MTKAALALVFSRNRALWWASIEGKLAFSLIIGTLPAVLIGYLIKDVIKYLSFPIIMGISSIVFGILLYLSDIYQSQRSQKLTFGKSLFIGCAQV
jgi:undecaprenyl-diphosphatase